MVTNIATLPHRNKNSHKGEYGRVMVIGGNEKYYGAPVLSALGTEYSGADLIHLLLPKIHNEIAKNNSLNFFVSNFSREYFSSQDKKKIIQNLDNLDAILIGNGIGRRPISLRAIWELLPQLNIPVILDADALQIELLKVQKESSMNIAITPHRKEFFRLFGEEATENTVRKNAKKYNLHILAKGPTDIISSNTGEIYLNMTGCPEMRVGGTGDVLAGIVTSFIAQGMEVFEACCSAAYFWGLCGEKLASQYKWITAKQMILYLPKFIEDNRNKEKKFHVNYNIN